MHKKCQICHSLRVPLLTLACAGLATYVATFMGLGRQTVLGVGVIAALIPMVVSGYWSRKHKD